MKLFATLLVTLLLSPVAHANNSVIWFVDKDKKEVLLPVWKVEAVERNAGNVVVRTSSIVVTVTPLADAPELADLDGNVVFYAALDRLIGHESTLTDVAYAAAVKAQDDKTLDAETRQKNAALILGYNRIFPCSSITLRDVGVPQ